jgi:glycosyltransferase involved in cell wall biosynthesis
VIFEGLEAQIRVGTVEELDEYLKEETFDLVSSLDTEEVLPLIKRLPAGTKFTLEVHTPYPESLEYLRRVQKTPINALLVPSKYQIGVVKEYLRIEVEYRVVPNPIGEVFVRKLENFSPVPRRQILAWIGRVDSLKNWREFIEIAGVLRTRGVDFECWLIGRDVGDRGDELVYRIVEGARMVDRLRWFRGVDYSHIPRFLDAVRVSGGIVVSTSRGDSFGMTVAEGMARGCAVLVPYEGPLHGFSYDLGNYYDAVEKMMSLLADDGMRRRFGLKAREDILESHAPVVALGAYAGVVREVCKQD